jgi:hypothetical protein
VDALSTLVWSDTDTTGYVQLSDTLELGDVSLSQPRELAGYTTLAASDAQLLVTNAETPSSTAGNETLRGTRFDVSMDQAALST